MRMIFAAMALAVWGGMAAADPLEGTWQSAPDDNGNVGHIEVTPCGAAFCGVLVRAYDGSGTQIESPNIGKRIIWDMEARGEGAYAGGKIWSPDRDKTYSAKMQLSGDSVAVSGCVIGICRNGGTWTRVK